MKAYGVRKHDAGCCPGHDKFPKESYDNNRSKKAQGRDTKKAHRRGRKDGKRSISKDQNL